MYTHFLLSSATSWIMHAQYFALLYSSLILQFCGEASLLKFPFNFPALTKLLAHHSWMGQSIKIMSREVVYYILSGTPRAIQNCFRTNLRVEFFGEKHLSNIAFILLLLRISRAHSRSVVTSWLKVQHFNLTLDAVSQDLSICHIWGWVLEWLGLGRD